LSGQIEQRGETVLADQKNTLKGSIVVIVRNGESSIRACLESLLRQTVQCEIIVVDGNSTDRTQEIVREFPVKLVVAPRLDSYGISRNIGVQSSTGDVILFMDADDYCDESWAENLVNNFQNDPQVGIVTVPREPIETTGWFMKVLEYEYDAAARRGKAKSDLPAQKKQRDWTSVTTKGTAWLKKAITDAGGFDGAMFFGTEDKDLAFRINKAGYKVVEDPSAKIRVAPVGSASNFIKDKYWRAGVGHGYMRRKYGVYRPPLGAVATILFAGAAAFLLIIGQPWLSLTSIGLSCLTLSSLAKEGVRLRSVGAPAGPTIKFLFVKWLSRLAEFAGFFRGYLKFKRR